MKSQPEEQVDPLTIEDEQIAKSQEAVPLPYMAGTRKIAVRWMTGALNRITQQSSKTPSKK